MCARPFLVRAATASMLAGALLAACGSPERTGTAFCRQLSLELPAIAAPAATGDDITEMVARWERLLERSPLAIESDVQTMTNLFRSASRVNPSDAADVQALADQSYAANKSAVAVRDWVMDTCAVDLATGLSIAPPRTAPPTTEAPPTDTSVPTETPATDSATTVAP